MLPGWGEGSSPERHGAAGALFQLMKVGSEEAGRYVYMSPDGERGAELGRGGIGRVLVAMDEHLGREVAIKELLEEEGHVDPEMMTRFLAEARITGQLEHPNIVPVYELGRRLDGRLYYTMRVVRGETMSAALERAKTLSARLALLSHFTGLCHAIAYAHSRGVVHRDIKPDNVMIGEFGETIVLDWGIAKLKGQPEMNGARVPRGITFVGETLHGDLVGTPLYMSPEQARGDVEQIDEASDVWSLGVVLYVLLAGRPPFLGKTTDEVVRKVTEGRFAPVQSIEPLAPSELCAVVASALCLDKAERYPSVKELTADIEAFMSGARVRAYDYSALELFRRFYRKHRAAAVVGLIALLSLVVVATELQRRILRARDRALSAESSALEKERVARQSLGEVFTERALNASLEGDVIGAELYAARALISGERADARGSIVAETNRHELSPRGGDSNFQSCSLLAGNGRGEVACAHGREIELFRSSGATRRWQAPDAPVRLALSADAKSLLTVFEQGRLIVYDTESLALRTQFRAEPEALAALALSDDGARFLTTTESGWAQLWETASASPVGRLQLDEPITARSFAPNGQSVVLGGRLGALVLWDTQSGVQTRLEGHRGTITAVAFAPRGEWLASAASDRTLSIWSTVTGKRLAPALRDLGIIQSLGWSPDGLTLAFGSDDRMLGLVDARHPETAARWRGHPGPVQLASFSSAEELVTVGPQLGLRLWSYRAPALPRQLAHKSNVLALAHAGPGVLAAAGLAQEGVCLWQISEQRCKTRLPVREGQVRALAVHPGTQRLASGTSLGQLALWDLATALPDHVVQLPAVQIRSLEFTRDGQQLLSSGSDGVAQLWDARSGQVLQRFGAGSPVQDALFDVEHARVLLGTRSGEIELWSSTGVKLGAQKAHADWTMDLALHAGSARLASAGGNGEIVFWSLAAAGASQLERLGSAQAHEGRALSVDVSPDGELFASGGEDGLVLLWDAQRRERVARLVHHRGAVRSVRFSGDGKVLSSGGDDGSVRLWDLQRLKQSGESLLASAERRSGVTLEGIKLELAAEPPRP